MAEVPSNYLSCSSCSGHFVNLLLGYTPGHSSGLNLAEDLGRTSLGLVLNEPISASLLFIFVLFKHKLYRKNGRLQRD